MEEITSNLISTSKLHHAIARHILDRGYAPSIGILSSLLEKSPEVVSESLKALQDYHGVVLHPHSNEIWVMHPFATAPTNFCVECIGSCSSRDGDQTIIETSSTAGAKRRWFGNCAWCSLGAAALISKHLDQNVRITTTLGGEVQQEIIEIRDGQLHTRADSNLLIHFPIPMRHAWDNVIHTCTLMQVFDGEDSLLDWCSRHGIQRGDAQPLAVVWEFAKIWYGRHLDEDWVKWTGEQAAAMFQQFGFTSDTWSLSSSVERF